MANSRYIFKRTGQVLNRGTGEFVCYYKRDTMSNEWHVSLDPSFPDTVTYWGETREGAVNSLLFRYERVTKTGRFAYLNKGGN